MTQQSIADRALCGRETIDGGTCHVRTGSFELPAVFDSAPCSIHGTPAERALHQALRAIYASGQSDATIKAEVVIDKLKAHISRKTVTINRLRESKTAAQTRHAEQLHLAKENSHKANISVMVTGCPHDDKSCRVTTLKTIAEHQRIPAELCFVTCDRRQCILDAMTWVERTTGEESRWIPLEMPDTAAWRKTPPSNTQSGNIRRNSTHSSSAEISATTSEHENELL